MNTGYQLKLPEDWRRFTLTRGGEADRFVREALPDLMVGDDPKVVMARHRVLDGVGRAFALASGSGAVDLYTFDREIEGARLVMMFTVGVAFLGADIGHAETHSLAEDLRLSGDDALEISLPAGNALRIRKDDSFDLVPREEADREALATAAEESRAQLALLGQVLGDVPSDAARTSVTYLVPSPTEDGSFAVVSLRAVGAEHVEARVHHFDLLMAGFSWVTTS